MLGRRVEMTAMRADGEEFPVELAITRIREGGSSLFTAYVRDISERKRAEDEIKVAKEAAEAANRAKDRVPGRPEPRAPDPADPGPDDRLGDAGRPRDGPMRSGRPWP